MRSLESVCESSFFFTSNYSPHTLVMMQSYTIMVKSYSGDWIGVCFWSLERRRLSIYDMVSLLESVGDHMRRAGDVFFNLLRSLETGLCLWLCVPNQDDDSYIFKDVRKHQGLALRGRGLILW